MFILLGGEPLLNNNLLDFCIIIRKYFSEAEISIMTNGILLKKIKKDAKKYKELDVRFDISAYPGYTDIELMNSMSEKNFIVGLNTRFTMQQTLVDDNGQQNPESNFFHCNFYQLPCFQVKNFKLYICPFAAYVDSYCKKYQINIPEEENDYLRLEDITLDKLHDFCFIPKNKCKYCNQQYNSNWPWHLSNKTKEEYNIPNLMQYYYSNYNYYKKIINNKDYFCNGIDKKIVSAKSEIRYGLELINDEFYKFGRGKLDIIIPYYNLSERIAKQLFNNLSQQTIIKQCMTYLISDGSTNDKKIIEIFSNANFPVTFLRTSENQGPGAARNEGINNSFNDYLVFLDADDEFSQKDSLEIIYNQTKNKDVYFYKMIISENEDGKEDLCVSRKLLNKYNLRYPKLYHGEDYIFATLIGCCPECDNLNKSIPLGYYHSKSENNITSKVENTSWTNFIFTMFFSLYYLNKLYLQNKDIILKGMLKSRINEILLHFKELSGKINKNSKEFNFLFYLLYLATDLTIIKNEKKQIIDYYSNIKTTKKQIYEFLKEYSMKYSYHKYFNTEFNLLFSILTEEGQIIEDISTPSF